MNIVTTSYNMAVWLAEAICSTLVKTFHNFLITIFKILLQIHLFHYTEKNAGMNTDGITVAYITITCGLAPSLYFLGIQNNRVKCIEFIRETTMKFVDIILYK